ncbi:undecaprenyl-diphosphate phosphatase [Usitatibacter palustris]|uniref:Undecaprenyl-diphosphatase n=1 Tax=Usitatibacter palustris TaxID=2732487 RepID=A0A6M4H448_9PROT|nr:undecaprenyl-diphosphate phosphatase [Usitatibacter palustris]QJR13264.1 Undecaprenyl-diphosphatase [Usitatibacter palustris]
MEFVALAKALILGVVEGLTEFLPISSTGHLIIVSDLLGVNDEKGKVFDIVIQLGAILAVCWEYRARFAKAFAGIGSDPVQQRFATNLAVAFVPAAAIGFFFQSQIKAHLFNPVAVAIALIVGAFAIFAIEYWYARHGAPRVNAVDEMNWKDALKVGLAQCLSLIPGTSRSGATIMGAMCFGLSRHAATEFSFFLAVPIMFAATGYQMVKYRALFSAADIGPFVVGFVVSFLAALLAVKALIRYVAHHDFKAFAWYRIVLGIAVLAYFL